MKFFRGGLSLTILGSFLTTFIPQGIQAHTAEVYEMKTISSDSQVGKTLQQFRFDMVTDWDVSNPDFKQHARTILEQSLKALNQNGVSYNEMLDHALNNVFAKDCAPGFKELMESLKKMEPEVAAQKAMNYMEAHYKKFADKKKILADIDVAIVGAISFLTVDDLSQQQLSGDSNKNGYNGTTGYNGTDSKNGYNGTTGYNGSDSKNGYNGTTGYNGSDSKNGYNGTTGYNGSDSKNGYNGTTGYNGTSGNAGF